MSIETSICPICCFDFTDVARKAIECNVCHFEVCTKCVKHYLLNTTRDPHCMKCNVAWNREFIDNCLSKAFRTGVLKKHRENVLLDREKSLLPSTITHVEAELERRKMQKEIVELNKEKQRLLDEVRKIDDEIYTKYSHVEGKRNVAPSMRVYQRPCPNTECRGYLSGWKCSVCDVKVCSKCHVVKGENDAEHVCNDDDIATAKLLEKDTKLCPNESCRTPIFKIEGCSQMFCTICHTAFDWKTGEIVKNQATIHNPHYYEWMRQQNNGVIPRNIGDVPCGGLPTIWSLNETLKRKKINVDISKYHRGIQHVIHYEIPRHPINLYNGETFTYFRVRYILKEVSEDEWKRELQRIEKKNERNTAFRHVFDMLTSVSIDMFQRIQRATCNDDVHNVLREMEELRRYFNDTLAIIFKRFDSKAIKGLNDNWVYDTRS